jgi:hypothetical protein
MCDLMTFCTSIKNLFVNFCSADEKNVTNKLLFYIKAPSQILIYDTLADSARRICAKKYKVDFVDC